MSSGRCRSRGSGCLVPSRDHVHQAAVSGYFPIEVLDGLGGACGPSTARPSPGIRDTDAKSRSSRGQRARPRVPRGNRRVAEALRFAPVRSFGFRMPCRERAVQLLGGGDAQGTVSGGPVRPGAHAARQDPASPPTPRRGDSESLRDRSWIWVSPCEHFARTAAVEQVLARAGDSAPGRPRRQALHLRVTGRASRTDQGCASARARGNRPRPWPID